MSRIHSKWLVVISVLFGTFTVILNNSMLNPTLPYFMETFDVDAVAVSWLLTIFMVSMGMTMPVTGYLGDRFGKKKIYMIGLAVFILGSLSGALSPTLPLIIISRAVQGIAGGLMMPIAMALILDSLLKDECGIYLGFYNINVSVTSVLSQ